MIAEKDIKKIQENRHKVNPSSCKDKNTDSFCGSLD